MYRLRVKEIADAKGMNMSKLSRSSDVSFSTIKRIFRNPQEPVSVDTLYKIARALGVTTSELIEDVPD
jgi:transcriptional regulator with XRE-family HTH domain